MIDYIVWYNLDGIIGMEHVEAKSKFEAAEQVEGLKLSIERATTKYKTLVVEAA